MDGPGFAPGRLFLCGSAAARSGERSISVQSGWAAGGEGGIRTHGTVARTPHFECGAFDHSATSPLGEGSAPRKKRRPVGAGL